MAHTFYWNNPRAREEFFDWVRSNDGGRTWTFVLLDSLWTRYQTGSAINHLDQSAEPTTEEVVAAAENMSDEELAATLTEARRLRSRSRY